MSALSWQSLTVRYGETAALTLGETALESGQLVALLGPNGSGKSTLFKALIGAIKAEVNGLQIGGAEASGMSRAERARRLAYLSQARTGPALATVRDVVALGRVPYRGSDPDNIVDKTLDRLDLTAFADRPFGTLSGGEQARVLLARTLAVEADILLVDEPTAALDPYYALSLMDVLKAEAARGALVIVSLHTLDLARRYADHALILQAGKMVASGPLDAALSTDTLKTVFRLAQTADGLRPIGTG